ncbi:MAG: DNA ligase, partial [Arcobacter sp.]
MKIFIILIFIISNIFSLNLEKPKIYKNQEINNWLMSEKLDGIRAYWDGESLYTKNGNKIFT